MADARYLRPAGRAEATRVLVFSVVGAVLAAALTPSCLESRGTPPKESEAQRCASCHGDATRPGDYLLRAAPPSDLSGRGSTRDPGVGAHALHLYGSPTHAAVPCEECHVVPDRTDSPGHADDDRPAELTFGRLARSRDHAPFYDARARTCGDSYCHGQAEPRWTAPHSSAEACGSCHGLPPPAPHPQSERCSACHGDVVDEQRRFVAPALHVNGKVEYRGGECQLCHGSQASPAPPFAVTGESSTRALGVGAHQAHLTGGEAGRALACTECHRVPDTLDEPSHVDGLPAKVTLTGVSQSGDRRPAWEHASATCADTWCHSPSPGTQQPSPLWNEPVSLGCASCHGAPPPAPHPQMTNCVQCHADVVASDNYTIVERARHVDGHVDVAFDQGCSSCHGSQQSPAPPVDVSGNQAPSVPGVGAHQAHIFGSGLARQVPCAACHHVPEGALEQGHIDTPLPAEVIFSGAALIGAAEPRYVGGSCQQTSCHGARLPSGNPSGGRLTSPSWTGTGQAACGSCHGLPPPPPHPNDTYPCSACHQNIGEDGVSFSHPELHVDGVVTFALP
jgi:predicted CxxxxCH...CXXCH cytochrome family protein